MYRTLCVRHHFLDCLDTCAVCYGCAASMSLSLSCLTMSVEEMAHVCVATDNLSVLRDLEAFLSSAVCFKLWHCNVLLIILLNRLGGKEHKHISSLELSSLLYICAIRKGFGKFLHCFMADLRMTHLSAAETN